MKRFWIYTLVLSLILGASVVFAQNEGTDNNEGSEPYAEDGSASNQGGENTGANGTSEGGAAGNQQGATNEQSGGQQAGGKKEPGAQGAVLWNDPESGTNFANSRVKFELRASDTLSDVDYIEYKVDEGDYQKYQGAITLSQEGDHTIVFRSVDKAGNKEKGKVYNVTIDNTHPQVIVLPGMAFIEKDSKKYTAPGNSLILRVSDNQSGVKTVKYSINSETLTDYKGEVIRLSSPGTHLIKYFAEDNLGNKTVGGNILVEVDAEKPVVEIVTTQPLIKVGPKQFAQKNTGFKVHAVDEGSGVDQILVRIDGNQEWQTYSNVLQFQEEADHTLEVKAVDAVGNESETKTIQFTVDDKAPKTDLTPVTN